MSERRNPKRKHEAPKLARLGLTAWASLAPLAALADVSVVGEPLVQFDGKGPAGFKVEGTTHELKVKDDGTEVTLVVPLADLDTGIGLRNRHMREKYLQVGRYPEASLTVPWASLQLPSDGQASKGQAKGRLTLHGKTKEVLFQYSLDRRGATYQVEGHLPVNLKDHDIGVPSYLGVTVQPDIETAVHFRAVKS